MVSQGIVFAVLFVATWIIHKPLNAHETNAAWLKTAHKWAEIATIVQGMIILNELID